MTQDINDNGGNAIRELRTKVLEDWGITKPDATPAGAVVADRSGVTAGETAHDFTSTPFTRQFKRDCDALHDRIAVSQKTMGIRDEKATY